MNVLKSWCFTLRFLTRGRWWMWFVEMEIRVLGCNLRSALSWKNSYSHTMGELL